MSTYPTPPDWVLQELRGGLVIPAHPLALSKQRRLDDRRQRALTRYYHAAGAGGIAVGVHTTQFEIREPRHALLKPVLELAAETIGECDRAGKRRTVRVAGICGMTDEATAEAVQASQLGYHLGLLSLGAMKRANDSRLLAHCRMVARQIPLFGFYLQPAVGGRVLSYDFWRQFVEIPNVAAIKIAAFNRYQTLDVVRAVADAGRAREIALYTGNDDAIVVDLLTEYALPTLGRLVRLRIVGGLLGHWACWTQAAVKLLAECQAARSQGVATGKLLTRSAEVTDCNAAMFDAANGFAGCIPGINEILRRQGLLATNLCLAPQVRLSPGQAKELDRVCRSYPHLMDDEFVAANLAGWLG